MTDQLPARDHHGRADARAAERLELWAQAGEESGPWHAGSVLVTGLLVFGGLGWLVGAPLGAPWLAGVGCVLGAGLALVSLWFRYGIQRDHAGDQR